MTTDVLTAFDDRLHNLIDRLEKVGVKFDATGLGVVVDLFRPRRTDDRR